MSVCFETTCQPRSMDIRELVLLTHPFVLSSFSPASSPPFLSSSRHVIPFIISKLGASFHFISKVRHFFQQPRYVFLLFEGRSFLSISKGRSFLFYFKVGPFVLFSKVGRFVRFQGGSFLHSKVSRLQRWVFLYSKVGHFALNHKVGHSVFFQGRSKVGRFPSTSRCVASFISKVGHFISYLKVGGFSSRLRCVVSSSLKVGPSQGESFPFPGRAAQSMGCPAPTFPWSPG